ncbi:MAG: hypothetical protein LBR33_08875 [Propionibacteriaceae bacterium]|jgi:hypothetical protein|nr:hypothetical protein [Propionibacteriaceae bacterium]
MRRVFWFGLGIAVTAFVVVKGRQMLDRATPAGILDQATHKGSELLGRAKVFAEDFGRARREAEQALRAEAGLPVTAASAE